MYSAWRWLLAPWLFICCHGRRNYTRLKMERQIGRGVATSQTYFRKNISGTSGMQRLCRYTPLVPLMLVEISVPALLVRDHHPRLAVHAIAAGAIRRHAIHIIGAVRHSGCVPV